jgi:hypothetical protein
MKMRFAWMALMLAAALPLMAQDAPADSPWAYKVVVDYDRPGLNVPHWQIVVPARGMVQYTGVPVKGTDPGTVLFRMSDAGRAKLGGMLANSKGMLPCETKVKGIASMGQKTVSYEPVGGTAAHCSFNYTDNKPLSEALNYVLAIVGTVQTGMELERLHRYDRLGLDPVMVRLVDDVKAGRAAELPAIQPTLESLVKDMALLERVRTRAQQLLDLAKQEDAATP